MSVQYKDPNGKSISLYKLVRDEPDWAVSVIKMGEGLRQKNEALNADLTTAESAVADLMELNDKFTAEHGRLCEGLKETTMLFRYMLAPESVINIHHCDEMDKLTIKATDGL